MIRARLASVRSARARAALSLGVVLAVGATGTYAHWTDAATLTGTSFTSGSIDVQLANNGGSSYGDNATTSTLSMTAMLPGASTAEVINLKNNGTAPLKWSLTGGLNGTDAATFGTAGAMTLTIRDGGSKSGTGQTSTCTGGSQVYSAALTSTTTTSLLSAQGPVAAAAVKQLCFQFTFDANAANSLQGKSLGATFTFTGTSDLS